jgi:hypothetical protein
MDVPAPTRLSISFSSIVSIGSSFLTRRCSTVTIIELSQAKDGRASASQAALPRGLEEVRQVLGQHDVLVDVNLTPGDLPFTVNSSKGVDSLPNPSGLFIF